MQPLYVDLKSCELENKKWKCPICSNTLSRKQTLQGHLWSIHNETVGSSKKYKKYETDETAVVPRSTLYRWSTQDKSDPGECQPTECDLQHKEATTSGGANCLHTTTDLQEQMLSSSSDESLGVNNHEDVGDLDQLSLVTVNDDKQIPSASESFTDTDAFPPMQSLDFNSIDRFDEDMDITTSDTDIATSDMDIATLNDNAAAYGSGGGSDDNDEVQSAILCNGDIQESHNCVSNDPLLYVTEITESRLISSSITVQEHVCAVGAFAARHNISDIAFRDLLSLVQLHIPKNNIGETRVQNLKAKCGFNKTYLNFHLYCEACNKLYSEESDICLTPGCTGSKSSGNSVKYFATSNLGSQLQEVLQREKLWELTRKHMQVVQKNICDIQGGLAYQGLLKPGQFLHNSNNITLSAFTDGVALFKSSGVQLWPVYLLINEIPPKERFHRKNMLLWGIWQGKGKPRMNMFLRPLVLDLLNLFHKGADIMIQDEKVNVKALLVVATMDLPARAYATNMTQYNGKFSCLYCEDEGTVVQSGAGTCRAFLSRAEPAKLRTSKSVNDCSVKALKNSERIMGFLGVSVLSYLPHFSLHSNVQIDYMHGILLGITKKLLDQWFDAKFRGEDFYIGDKTAEVDKHLAGIQPPYIIHRTPRSIGHTLKNWKASEFRNWLLFYAIPCLMNILPNLYLKHFSLLVEATYLLLSTGITPTDLNKADLLLHAFLENAQLLYGQNFMGLNVHNLVHLVSMVKMWGPLWAWSCFPFESFNGELKKTIHGTGNVCKQIFWSFQAEKRILHESSKIDLKSGTRKYIEQLFDTQDGSSTCTDAYMCQVLLPKCKIMQVLSEKEKTQVKTMLPICKAEDNFIKLLKVMRNGFVFSTKRNSTVSKQNSYTFLLDPRIQQRQDVFAFEAEAFLLHELTMRVVCKGRFLKHVGKPPGMSTTHIHLVEYGDNGMAKVESMLEPLIVMPMKDQIYCASFPNIYERD